MKRDGQVHNGVNLTLQALMDIEGQLQMTL